MKKHECYIVQEGDTLTSIAANLLGSPSGWLTLWAINRRHLRGDNPNNIYPGEIILLPPGCQERKEMLRTPLPWHLRIGGDRIEIVGDADSLYPKVVCEFPTARGYTTANNDAEFVMKAVTEICRQAKLI